MKIEKIHIQNFRNLSNLNIEFNPNINIILGNNGQGKSNLLEAIGILALGRSFRVNNDKALLQWNKSLFYLKSELNKESINYSLEMGYDGKKKKVKVNEVEKNKLVDFIGNLKVVYFTPDDLSLVKEGPFYRRRFLDTMLCQVSNRYCMYLATYQKIVEQRNKLLKEKPLSVNTILDSWDVQLSNYATEIWLLRKKAVERISQFSNNFFKNIASSEDNLNIKYDFTLPNIPTNLSKETLLSAFIQSLKENRGLEFHKGYTLYGPHKDDIYISLNNMDSKIYASQGQQRLISLSLKIAEMNFIEEFTNEIPVLLLDDIFSELDNFKIDNLLSTLSNSDRQVFITTTNLFNLNMSEFTLWNMNKGIIKKEERE